MNDDRIIGWMDKRISNISYYKVVALLNSKIKAKSLIVNHNYSMSLLILSRLFWFSL